MPGAIGAGLTSYWTTNVSVVSPKFQPGLERRDVGVADVGDLGEPLAEERDRGLGRPAVHPRQQPEREHVLGPGGVLAGQAELLDRLDRHPGQVDRVDRELAQLVVGVTERRERVRRVAGLGQVARGEVVGVHDDRGALGQVAEVGLQRRRVHRDQHVGGVARGEDVVVGEVDLERRDAGQRALRGADLGGEVRQRHQVVAEGRRLLGEPVAGQLHPVAGVAGEPDDHAVELLDLLGHVVAPPRCNQSWCSSHTYDEACWLGVLGLDSVIRRPSIVPAVCENWNTFQFSPVRGARRTRPSLVRRACGPHPSLPVGCVTRATS